MIGRPGLTALMLAVGVLPAAQVDEIRRGAEREQKIARLASVTAWSWTKTHDVLIEAKCLGLAAEDLIAEAGQRGPDAVLDLIARARAHVPELTPLLRLVAGYNDAAGVVSGLRNCYAVHVDESALQALTIGESIVAPGIRVERYVYGFKLFTSLSDRDDRGRWFAGLGKEPRIVAWSVESTPHVDDLPVFVEPAPPDDMPETAHSFRVGGRLARRLGDRR